MNTLHTTLPGETNFYDDGILTIKFYTASDGKPCAIAMRGKARKPWFNYKYMNEAQREQRAQDHINAHLADLKRKENDKIEQKNRAKVFLEALKPGVILSDSWGWEQTNVEFYKVISVKGSKVTLQELGHVQDGEGTSWAGCNVLPSTTAIGEPITKTVRGIGIKIDSSVTLTLWDGRPKYKSWYA